MGHHQPAADRTALVLTGGGARAAYQVGVLKAAAELLPKRAHNPFSIITGTSAGAVNAVALGASANNFRLAVKKVERIWSNLHVEQVYKAGYRDLCGAVLRLVASLFHQGIGLRKPLSLLNSDPLAELLSQVIDFGDLERRLEGGLLDAIGVTASSYASGESVTFYQSNLGGNILPEWRQARRRGVATRLGINHLLASSAIPTLLPAARIGDAYYGDGALRQVAPISAAIHLGAERIMVVGVSGNPNRPPTESHERHSPSLARMVGHVFNSAFIDALENDMEHVTRINELVGVILNENPHASTGGLKLVDFLCINPSVEINGLVARHMGSLPRAMRRVLRMTGATPAGGGTSMASYLLFEGAFCRELIACGYRDAMAQEEALMQFFYPPREVMLRG
ncbi:MAG: patatin-like phospholipase family protein [Halioglobus sp.]|nr:patatin-like phospholipase family protein [Halioglobus sp.]MCB1709130.1 patatin-like phospholipase family protein [Halioglobus sp.]MCP5123608.1 patatin-like phospholipase family protein [Pseudomonadales bacterium]MCP5193555.1 patatin-like phospholipase family protein [Pseudomonadales bacterium]